jgi:hypothetical protein
MEVELRLASHGVPTTAREILGYFVRNPDAADSLEGIVRWRLLEQVIHRTISDTEVALKWLVAEGYLIETELPHSRRLFRLNPEKYGHAQNLLAGEPRV